MLNKKSIALSSTILLLLTSCNQTGLEKKDFYYGLRREGDYKSQYYYSDDYFDGNATTYNPSLSTLSFCFALTCGNSSISESYENKDKNAVSFLTENGFENVQANQYYKVQPTTDSLGVIIGEKQHNGKTLLAVGIRGMNYEREWASNVTLGNDEKGYKQAQGFYEAAQIYLETVDNYISNNNISGDIEIWSVGYSRAGGANNIASGLICQQIKNNNVFSNKVKLSQNDFYSYCFEAPQGASFKETISPRDSMYDNIHNIINFNDVVTKVAPSLFSFTRYGVDHYLIDKYLNPVEYEENIKSVKKFYKNMEDSNTIGEYQIDDFDFSKNFLSKNTDKGNLNIGFYLENLLDVLSSTAIQSLDYYVETYQNSLRTIFSIIYAKGMPKTSFMSIAIGLLNKVLFQYDADFILHNLLHDTKTFVKDFVFLLTKTLKDYEIELSFNDMLTCTEDLLLSIFGIFLTNSDLIMPIFSRDNIKAIGSAHYPELCLAHLMSQDKNYTNKTYTYNDSGEYFTLNLSSLGDNFKVIIKDNDGNMVSSICDEERYSTLAYRYRSKNLTIYIPLDQNYEIEIDDSSKIDTSFSTPKYESEVTLTKIEDNQESKIILKSDKDEKKINKV